MSMSKPEPEMGRFHRRRILIAESADSFRPLEPDCKVVQFDRPLNAEALGKAAVLMCDRPDVQLYVYGRASRDLYFLGHFNRLRRLQLSLYELEDVAGLSSVGRTLEELTFSSTRQSFSLRFLENLPHLRSLFLQGHKKHLSSIHALNDLDRLGLSGVTLPDLSILLPLAGLRDLSILFCGTRDLGLLPRFTRLERLMLMRITRLSDLGILAGVSSLKDLHLDWMRNVTELPSFAPLRCLEKVKLDTMKGLKDLSAVAAAPMLRELVVGNMPQLGAEDFRCLLGHPHLRKLAAYVGRRRANLEIKAMFAGIAV